MYTRHRETLRHASSHISMRAVRPGACINGFTSNPEPYQGAHAAPGPTCCSVRIPLSSTYIFSCGIGSRSYPPHDTGSGIASAASAHTRHTYMLSKPAGA